MDHAPCYAEYIVAALDKLPAGKDTSATKLREDAPKGRGRKAEDFNHCVSHLAASDHVVVTKVWHEKPSQVKRGSAPAPKAPTDATPMKGAKALNAVEEAHKAVKKLMDRRRNVQHMRLNYAWAVQRGDTDYAKRIREHLDRMIQASGGDVPGFYTDMRDQLVNIDRDPKSVLVQASFFPPGERDGDQTGEMFRDLKSIKSLESYYDEQIAGLRAEITKLNRRIQNFTFNAAQDAEGEADRRSAGEEDSVPQNGKKDR